MLQYAGQTPLRDARKITVGMVMYIVTDMLLGLMFFITYLWLRSWNTNDGWYPAGVHAPPSTDLLWPLIALLVSALAYSLAQYAIRLGWLNLVRGGLLAALIIVFGTLIWEIYSMGHLPFDQGDGSFASSYLLLLGYHIVHLAIAVFVGFGVTFRAFRGYYTAENHVGIDVVGVWWYWVVTFAALFWLIILMQPASLHYL